METKGLRALKLQSLLNTVKLLVSYALGESAHVEPALKQHGGISVDTEQSCGIIASLVV